MLCEQRELQLNKMCSAFWVAAQHAHKTDVLSPYLYISVSKRPNPALRRFRVTHIFRGKSDSGGAEISRDNICCLGGWCLV